MPRKRKQKKNKTKKFIIDILRMWDVKCMIIPLIIGATGILKNNLKKNLEAIPVKHSIDSLQKTAILGTSYILRKLLQSEISSLSGGITISSRLPGRKGL
jgi:polyferredoxin